MNFCLGARALLWSWFFMLLFTPALRAQTNPAPRIYRDKIEPHWFAGNQRFWYRNDLRDGAREFIVVDAERGKRAPAFDHAAVAQQIGAGSEATKLPFNGTQLSARMVRR
jgi:hypothetical protein